MEPESFSTHAPNVSAEKAPLVYGAKIELNNNQINREKNTEIKTDVREIQPTVNTNISDAIIATSLPTPVLNTATVAKSSTRSNDPVVANDDGLIEKEWVNKAKNIISNTRNDPYAREEKVNELQTDYLKKRYGEGLDIIK